MNYKVVYFTRTGRSKRIAGEISNKLNCENIQITDNFNWKGLLGFIKGGYYVLKNKNVDIKMNHNLSNYDELIVVTPLWAGKITPAIRKFLENVSLSRVHLVVTSNGSKLIDRKGYKSVSDIVEKDHNEEDVINNLINNFL
ncbi:flavodoxin family protein [Clostridium weizhouense]|uniref:Flavodoxin domain-containing protein n=1 Tax=Clostridium weizhouense TaxID=2859781 RepID=A0ABS7AUP7_9CLOT|nr:flavodoxin domain-containing protein [Clostridium weizhouense]MBW6411405.1 flavodoxin domain-containing protein [Clostridium weizhouense]